MGTKESNEASQILGDRVDANEPEPSRRELLIQGSKMAASIEVAFLVGNVGAFPSKSCGMG